MIVSKSSDESAKEIFGYLEEMINLLASGFRVECLGSATEMASASTSASAPSNSAQYKVMRIFDQYFLLSSMFELTN
jgi:hypothetical protein